MPRPASIRVIAEACGLVYNKLMASRHTYANFFFPFLYRLLKVYWFFRRPRYLGAKVIAVSLDSVLLVRHTYQDKNKWHFPGGGAKRGEGPEEAALRELWEEVGIRAERNDLTFIGTVRLQIDYVTSNVYCYVIELPGRPEAKRSIEVDEARWFPPAKLPPLAAGQGKIFDAYIAYINAKSR